MMDSKRHGIPLTKWYNFGPGLHPWPLFRQYKLATRKISSLFRKQDGYL
jgi:hypothetical protein